MMTAKMGERDSREEIMKAFRLFDEEGRGKIGIKELKRVAKELGENMTDEELQEMIDEADRQANRRPRPGLGSMAGVEAAELPACPALACSELMLTTPSARCTPQGWGRRGERGGVLPHHEEDLAVLSRSIRRTS